MTTNEPKLPIRAPLDGHAHMMVRNVDDKTLTAFRAIARTEGRTQAATFRILINHWLKSRTD